MTKKKFNIIRGLYRNGDLLLYVDECQLDLQTSIKVRDHSPTGFGAGYGGAGPAQSALAILLHVTTEKKALHFYQDFKWDFLAHADYYDEDFALSVDIHDWMKKKYEEEFYPINLLALKDSGLEFEFSQDEKTALFRIKGKPMVDFYIGKGTWKTVGDVAPGTYFPNAGTLDLKRGAYYFLKWYEKQGAELIQEGS